MSKHVTIELTHVERGKVTVFYSEEADSWNSPCWVDDNSDGTRSYSSDEFEETDMQIWKKWRAINKQRPKLLTRK